jgi:hypothetical protein
MERVPLGDQDSVVDLLHGPGGVELTDLASDESGDQWIRTSV